MIHRGRSLQVVVLAPVLALMLVAGATLYGVVLRAISQFADRSIRTNLASLSSSAFTLADTEVDRQSRDAMPGDEDATLMYKLNARIRFEDFARAHDVGVFVLADGEVDFATGVDRAAAGHIAERMSGTQVERVRLNSALDAYVQPTEFAPWRWRIVLVKDATAFQALVGEVRTIYVASGALMVLVTLLLVAWLRQVLVRPIFHIAGEFAEGRAPEYKGVRELEVLSDRLEGMMRSLREKSLHLETSLASMSDGIAVYDADMRLVAWNDQYATLNRYPLSLMRMGTPLSDIIRFNAERGDYGPGDPDLQHARMLERARNIDPPRFEIERPDGATLEARRAPMPDGGFVTTYSDVTDRKQAVVLELARRRAEAANEAKAQFLRDMSHDLRKPINAVIEYADLVAEQTRDKLSERERRNVDHIGASARHLLEMIDALLEIARIDAGQVEANPEPVTLGPLIEHCIHVVGSAARAKGLALGCAVEDLQPVDTDPHLLSRVLVNLLDNAIKYTRRGRVDLNVAHTEGAVRFAVSDTGVGITDVDLATVFEKFRQLDPCSGLARPGVGLGLGLSISREFAHLLGGQVDVESEPGVGSTFTLTIPAATPSAPAGRSSG